MYPLQGFVPLGAVFFQNLKGLCPSKGQGEDISAEHVLLQPHVEVRRLDALWYDNAYVLH